MKLTFSCENEFLKGGTHSYLIIAITHHHLLFLPHMITFLQNKVMFHLVKLRTKALLSTYQGVVWCTLVCAPPQNHKVCLRGLYNMYNIWHPLSYEILHKASFIRKECVNEVATSTENFSFWMSDLLSHREEKVFKKQPSKYAILNPLTTS